MPSLSHGRDTVIQVCVVVALACASVACATTSEPTAATPTPAPTPQAAEPETAQEPVGANQDRAVDNLMQLNAALWDVELNRTCIAETVAGLAPSDIASLVRVDPTDIEAKLDVSPEANDVLVSALFTDCPEIDSYRAESVKNVGLQPGVDIDCATEQLASLMTVEEMDEFVNTQMFDICPGT